MHLEAERHIPRPIDRVWAAINDVDILRASIPDCQSLERQPDGALAAVVRVRVGPLSAPFRGRIVIDEAEPPHRCRLTGEGDGAAAGFARGQAVVSLAADPAGGTRLAYRIDASVGGRLAQIGQRLIDGAARDFAEAFFAAFAARLGDAAGAAGADGDGDGAAAASLAAAAGRRRGMPPWLWVPALIGLTLAMLLLFNSL